jgi:hypothetical protein
MNNHIGLQSQWGYVVFKRGDASLLNADSLMVLARLPFRDQATCSMVLTGKCACHVVDTDLGVGSKAPALLRPDILLGMQIE